MTKKTMRNLQAGDVIETGYRDNRWKAEFLGFTENYVRYSDVPVFENAKALFEVRGVNSFKALEAQEDNRDYGFTTSAVFKSLEDGDIYRAYLFKGKWCLGTSADAMRIYND